MQYRFLTPWKLRESSPLQSLCQDFLGRISRQMPTTYTFSQSTLAKSEEVLDFYTRELKKLTPTKVLCFCFDENGKNYDSQAFAKLLARKEMEGEKMIAFCFGGAYGLPSGLERLGRLEPISLSAMTFPHELAFLMALEQIYRARCILGNHPYHHGNKSSLITTLQTKK